MSRMRMNPITYPIGKLMQKDAAERLQSRFDEEKIFGVPMQPTAEDLMDYQTATEREWPKRGLTVEELQRMQADIGGTDIAVDAPREVIAEPLTGPQRAVRAAVEQQQTADAKEEMEMSGKPDRWRRSEAMLSRFLGPDFNREDVLANMGMKRADMPTESEVWGDPYHGPDGALLQRSNRGRVSSVLGRHDPAAATSKAEDDALKIQRNFRADTMRLYGASDFSALDQALIPKVNEISEIAMKNYMADPQRDYNRALSQAYTRVEARRQVLGRLPRANRSVFGGNAKEAATAVREAMAAGIAPEEVGREMTVKGWRPEEVQAMLGGNADTAKVPAGGTPPQAPQQPGGVPMAPAGPPAQVPGAWMSDAEKMQRFMELRRQGVSAPDAAQQLGIPLR